MPERERAATVHASSFRNVEMSYTEAAWEVVLRAYQLAHTVETADIEPAHFFSAALGSHAGGIFLTRLGINFDTIKPQLAERSNRKLMG